MVDQEAEIKARDNDAESFDEWYLGRGYYYDLAEKWTIFNALKLCPNDVVLDAGSGTGRITRAIARRCKKVYGIDFSPQSIEVLRKKIREDGLNNVELSVGDIAQPFQIKEKADRIVSIQVVQHIPTEEARVKVLKNFYDHLNVGGRCVVTVFNWANIYKKLQKSDQGRMTKEGKWDNGIYFFQFAKDEARRHFAKAGFEDVEVKGCVNFRKYHILDGSPLRRLFYPIAVFDTFLSGFEVSCYLGDFLVCSGVRKR